MRVAVEKEDSISTGHTDVNTRLAAGLSGTISEFVYR